MVPALVQRLVGQLAFGRLVQSQVAGFEGPCKALWMTDHPGIERRYGGRTGFFRRAVPLLPGLSLLTGEEFYGLVGDGESAVVRPVPGADRPQFGGAG